MSERDSKAAKAKAADKDTLKVTTVESNHDKALAQTALRPSVQAGVTLHKWTRTIGELDLTHLVDELSAQAKAANNGDMARCEAMLAIQAHTLDAIFNELARRAALNMGEYLSACEIYLRLALKAQSQCRTTLETLAEMKHPSSVAFVRQANIANGPQQVNNGSAPEVSRAGNPENPQNKLLEQQHEEWLDRRAPGATVRADSDLEPVETIDGTKNAAR